ncbi:MAG: hypothetical protein B7Y51_11350 [Burkholderiales bacterium 28-67-8]|nr:MAG: hypothetical protein B7Y51_11350 [Burkholderiales bacterium 28-67-8]
MKQLLLRSPIGRLSLALRDQIALLGAARTNHEALGTLSNDILAGKLVTAIAEPNKTFIDVGAHIGSIIAEVLAASPTTKVIAFEAIPEKADALRRSFPSVRVHCCAAGDVSGEASFFIDSKQSGYSGLSRATGKGHEASVVEIRVPVVRLDDVVKDGDVDVIKIDVEGAELGVLLGSVNLIGSCLPVIMFESGPPSDDGLGYTREGMYSFLTEHGYSIFVPNRLAHNGPGLSCEGFLESHAYPRRCTNYFAVPDQRITEIRDRARHVLGVRLS